MDRPTDRRRALVAGGASMAVVAAMLFALPAYLLRTYSREGAAESLVASLEDDAFDGANSQAQRSGGATRAADEELGRRIGQLIESSEAATARWGVHVVSLRDGRSLYAREAGRLFTPASTMKLYTTAVALDALGADYRWRTSVYAAAQPDPAGSVAGDLVLYGRGAPDLSSRPAAGRASQLAELADKLYARGVRRVGGDVVGDESYFRGEALGAGWQWEDVQWYYGAEPSALSLDDNEVTLVVAPAREAGGAVVAKTVPPLEEVRVTSDLVTVERGSRPTFGVTRELSSNTVRVWGELPAGGTSYNVRLSVQRPALLAAARLRDALKARGIQVAGGVRVVDGRTPTSARIDTANAVELASVLSAPLAQVVRKTNKHSFNLYAELMLRTIGKERAVAADEAERTRNELDTAAAGLAVIRRRLEEAGVETSALALRDGSGLSRLNLVTPEATTRLLAQAARASTAKLFRDSLPVAGRDGTLERRLSRAPAAGRVAAKTGSFTNVNALAGYAATSDGEPLAFFIVCNDETRGSTAGRVIDEIATLLAAYPNVGK